MTEVWLGTWSVKDIVAHMAGWHREMAPALERLARGEKPIPEGVSYDDIDEWNARFTAAAKDTSVADVLVQFDKSHEEFSLAAQRRGAERWQPRQEPWK